VLVDGLGVLLGAQYAAAAGSGCGAWRRDVSLQANVAALSALVEGGRSVRQRLVWGPAAASGGGAWRRWRQCGYEARRCGTLAALAEGCTSLQGEMAAELDHQLRLSAPGARRTVSLLLSRRGDKETALAAAAGRALQRGWDVEVWAWEVGACDWVLDWGLVADGPGKLSFFSFDGARDNITYTAAAVAPETAAKNGIDDGSGSSSRGGSCEHDDSDDDWAMCPITCEPITDPVMVRGSGLHHFERSALEAWIARAGSCPLTRRPLSSDDVVPAAPTFAVRLAALRVREGLAE
jgi:hypothetical protein